MFSVWVYIVCFVLLCLTSGSGCGFEVCFD